jgi:serine protease Do
MQSRNATRVAVVAAAVGLVVGGSAALGLTVLPNARAMPPPPPPAASAAAPTGAALPDFSAIVRRYGPAVVNVSTTGTTKAGLDASGFGQIAPDDPFWQFFRRFGVPMHPQGEGIVHGQGSGFVVRSDGVILTNAHVVDGASEVRVKLTDKREFSAKVVGRDKATDVAVLRIDAKDLPTVRLGEPSHTQVGEWVLAIGSPFGFENSATAGIVSARARSLPDEGYVPFLQTDVAVNPGNSGGPLFNLAGDVIGINSQIYSRSGGYMGLSFAIPIDVAMKVEEQILAHGTVVRGRIGVTIQDVNQDLAKSFGLAKPAGALVSSVENDSPAAKAGLEPGDVILSLNGQEIAGSSDLPPRVADLTPGAKATLEIWRKGHLRKLEVGVAAAKDAKVASADESADHGRLGITVRPLTPEEQRQADVRGGVLVEGASGPAARAGIQPGDVVLSLNGTPVTGVEQLRELITKTGKHVAVLVQRGQARIFVPVALG